jgi:hypothetical protein
MAMLPATPAPEHDPDLFSNLALYAEMRRYRPALVSQALAEDPNFPRLFSDRDLPLITASGLDPQVLASLPWPLRRPVAEASTLKIAYELISKYADSFDMVRVDLARGPSNLPYVEAMSQWLIGNGRMPADLELGAGLSAAERPHDGQADRSVEALHQELFGSTSYDTPARQGRP